MKLEDLYFGVKLFDFNTKKLQTRNLFGSLRVLHSVAVWLTLPEEAKKSFDLIPFCFGDTSHRIEYEMIVGEYIQKDENNLKVQRADVYELYVEPNADYLASLVEQVPKEEAEKWLKENGYD